MAPAVRRKKLSTTPPPKLKPALSTATPRLSPSKIPTSTNSRLRSPIRKINNRGLTSPQKRIIIDNLLLEINERVRRLRAQYEVQAQALRHRIEMRINRVPKKLWNAKMGDLLLKHATAASSTIVNPILAAGPVDARALVEEVKRLSGDHETSGSREEERESKKSSASESLVVAKKRVTKKVTSTTCRTDLPLPQVPVSTSYTISTSSISPSKTSISRVVTHPPSSPVKRVYSPLARQETVPRKYSPLPSSQIPHTDSSIIEAPLTPLSAKSSNVKPAAKVSRSNAVKQKALKSISYVPPPVPQENERHYIKNTLSSGSLKENKVEGVVKKDKLDKDVSMKAGKVTTGSDRSTNGGRGVLRQRK
ncbi:Borealin N terminal-domain-containing protein [Tirmania nivea]|nr:Borealin N terminal-domain-containing protein [Tirmania nivea]